MILITSLEFGPLREECGLTALDADKDFLCLPAFSDMKLIILHMCYQLLKDTRPLYLEKREHIRFLRIEEVYDPSDSFRIPLEMLHIP
jgi:hypothetical protein